jgi:hypothetical protein
MVQVHETDLKTDMEPNPQAQTLLLRHQRDCRVCRHLKREEIEEAFVAWHSPRELAKRFGVTARAVYRHAHAFNLFPRRNRNIRAALGQIIEQVGHVRVTASTIVAAIAVLSKINANGQWVDRRENVSLNRLFDKMSQSELERYARDGTLPQWFERTVRNAGLHSSENEDS